MSDTIAMPAPKTYPGVLFPLTVILLFVLIGLAWSNYQLQKQVQDLTLAQASLGNQLHQVNNYILTGDLTPIKDYEEAETINKQAGNQLIVSFEQTGLSFRLPAGFVKNSQEIPESNRLSNSYVSYNFNDGTDKTYYTFTLFNAESKEQATVNSKDWKLAAEINVDKLSTNLYKNEDTFKGAELYVVKAKETEIGFLFTNSTVDGDNPSLSFGDVIAKILASVDIK
ncbi:MAG: hypothetical protein QY330_03655 [Candidatus Dojkabacteria bacterium]|uniref:Uncharacterized protein n=2 Tax=Candidatus Dojkabacteria TaxID=74243 RepID=A0A136KG04_9BACT|nr:MAG: hypothetical protein UZ20_WS6002000869 [candidate division WS6 bacterium OLB21]MBW7953411.1 hypothetical protein [Candidatus Dojkabacteria bacterium]WKZ27616.1 MAG: hypothetical protein QY330_03655 [Candidatus Dojkabacteria bacterium]